MGPPEGLLLTLKRTRMELQTILGTENVSINELQIAITTMEGIRVSTELGESPPVVGVSTAEETLKQLQGSLKELRSGLSKFMDTAFTATSKGLTKEKKDNLVIISEGLNQLKKEFRLPSRVEIKPGETRRAKEAWGPLKDAYLGVAKTLLQTTRDLNKGSSSEAASIIAWSGDDTTNVMTEIQKATKELLLVGIFLKQIYGKALTKAHLEFGHGPYNQAFEALKGHKIGQRLKSAKRKARQSNENRMRAISLLEEEQNLFIAVVDKWEKECLAWESRKHGISSNIFQEQQRLIDKSIGVSHVEALLPDTTEVAVDTIKELLDFIPSIKDIEDGLTNHGQEAEEIVDRLDEELGKIREGLEPRVDLENTLSVLHHSTPRRRVTFGDEVSGSVLSHDNTLLSNALDKLRSARKLAQGDSSEASREILKARAETARNKRKDVHVGLGTEEEVREAYTLLEELDEEITKAMAFISLEERKEERRRDDERTKGIMAAKSTPATKIPYFSGRREDFWEWFYQFLAAIPKHLPDEMRAGQLRSAIRDPATQDVIKGCQTYEELEDELRRHFGSKEDELNRLIAQLDLMPKPKNKPEESMNFETLRKTRRKLRLMKETKVLNKLKLSRISIDSFLPRTREELLMEIREKRSLLIQEYSIDKGIGPEEANNLALREEIPDLEIPNEEYCAIFWNFLEARAEVSRVMKAQTNVTGPLGGNPRETVTFRSNRIESSRGNEASAGEPWFSQCAFKNCQSADHFTTRCDKNLQSGDVPPDIIQLCRISNVCVRCLRSLGYTKHDETCIGAYKRKSDNQWVQTDCKNQNCKLTLANGRKVNLNKRICHHATEKSKRRRGQAELEGATATTKVNQLQAQEEDDWDYEVPSAAIYASTAAPISNRLVVNDINCGEASQLVEWLNVGKTGQGSMVLAMYDLGTSCSVVDIQLARKYGFKREKARFTISTVTGGQEGSELYSFYIRDSNNKRVEIQALGIDIRQHYPMTKIKVRKPWRDLYEGQTYQRAPEGYLGLLLGSDQSRLHPRQVSFGGNEVLWRSYLTGRYLISGGRNEAADIPTINKISVALPKDSQKKINLSTKVTTSRVQNGRVVTMTEDMKEKVFKQLTGLDSVLVTPCTACQICRDQTDRMAEQDLLEFEALRRTVSFDEEKGRYKGDFLYLEDKVMQVKPNSEFARRNSENLYRKLSRLPAELVKDFDETLECAKEMGALRRTSEVEGLNEGYPQRHIPINFAFSGKESSTKIRPTFNCGWFGGKGDLSFNDLHITGPRNLNNLDQSMLFFKTNAIVGLIDVKKFFWTCLVSPRTASLNRIWLPEGGYSSAKLGELSMQEWCWTTLTFGQAGAPALSGVIRHQAADDFCKIEEVKRQVKEKALVDDILIGASNKEQFSDYQKDVEQMLQKSGMKYHNWIVSSRKSDGVVDFDQAPIKESAKIFGYLYDQEKDKFVLHVEVNLTKANRGRKFGASLKFDEDPLYYIQSHKLTYRKTLGFTLSLWDLTGYVLPIQMLLRLLYRELLEDYQKTRWDDEIPEDYQVKYANLFKRLLTFEGLSWDRSAVPALNWDEAWGCRLATFFDGSQVASTAYTYLVTRRLDGSYHSRLLWAKGRLGSGSVPRNELGAAFLAVKMNNFIEKYLHIKIRDITYFGDSQAVLYQIASRSILYDPWARARLRAIHQGSRGSTWLYIPAKENVADIGSKNSSRISRGTMESSFYQRGNFLEEPEWKGVQLGNPAAETLAGLPEIKKCYRSSPITLLNTYTISEEDNIECCTGDCQTTDEIEERLGRCKRAEPGVICNNLLGKYKKTQRVTKINRNMERDALPDFLVQAKRRLEQEDGVEYFSILLLKFRSLEKVERILSLVLKWKYTGEINLREKVRAMLTRHAAIATIRYLGAKGVSFGPLRLDSDNRVWCKNRPLLECKESKVLPEETLVLAPTTSLARLIARSYHDKNHHHASTAVQTIVRKDLNVRIPNLLKMLDSEESQCTKCRHHRRTPYKPLEAGVPLQRHNLRNRPFTSICIDGIGPFKVRSLHRQDRRMAKVWALISVDQPTGLAHISILMDSSSHSVQVALESLKVEWNVEIDLITLDPATSFVGLNEEGWIEQGDNFDIEDLQTTVVRAGYPLKLSPPKASWFQALCEKRVDMIKQALYFQPKRALHVIELELIFKKIILDLNNKPVLLKQSQDSFISISRMDLLGKFYHPSEGGMFKTSKAILKDIELIEECAQESRIIFNEIYTEKLREYSRWKYPGLTPEVGDIVGVPDKEVRGEPRMGRITELISPHEAKVEMARPRKGHPYPEEKVTTRKATFLRSPHSLYLIERPARPSTTFDMRSIEAGIEPDEYLKEVGVGQLPRIEEEREPLEELDNKVDGNRVQNGNEFSTATEIGGGTKVEEAHVMLNKGEEEVKGLLHEEQSGIEGGTKEVSPKLGRGMRIKYPTKLYGEKGE